MTVTDEARITYGTEQTERGWILRVRVSGPVPALDRIILIDWIRDYSEKVRLANPLAATFFRQEADGYALEVILLERYLPPLATAQQLSLAYV